MAETGEWVVGCKVSGPSAKALNFHVCVFSQATQSTRSELLPVSTGSVEPQSREVCGELDSKSSSEKKRMWQKKMETFPVFLDWQN